MALNLQSMAIQNLNRYSDYPYLVSSPEIKKVFEISVDESKEMAADRFDLNGVSKVSFFIAETASSNDIPTFDITAKFYEENGIEITGSSETLTIPLTTAGTNQLVEFTSDDYILRAAYMTVSFTLPYVAAYTANLAFNFGLGTSGGAEVTQSVASALNTLVSGVVEPTTTYTAGSTANIALNEEGIVKSIADDPVGLNHRTVEQNPKNMKFDYDTDLIDETASSATVEEYLDMDGYDSLNLQFILSAGAATFTVEGTLQNDGTAASSCTYHDVTSDAYGAANYTASDILADPAGYFGGLKYVKVKVVTVAGTCTVHAKRKVM